MKSKVINYVRLLGDYLYYISSNHLVKSIIYPTCILIVIINMLYAKLTLGYNFKIIAESAIILLIIELSLFYLINIILFTFDYPYSRLHERNQVRKINEALNIQHIKHIKEKEEIKKIVHEKNKEIRILENEKDEISQRLENEIFSDEYKSYKKANDEHFKLIKKLEERHKKIAETTIKYVLLELDFFKLKGLEKMFITNTLKTFVDTGLMANKTEFETPLKNRYKIKSKNYITITRYELAHLAANLAKYLDKDLKETAKLCAYIFACEDDVNNICKDAKKGRKEDRIKLIDDIEEYVKSKEIVKSCK